MIRALVWVIYLLSSSTAFSEVSLRICEADGNTPFDCNAPVMVGTRLTIYADSNSAASLWLGGIDINKPAQNPDHPNGRLFGRGWNSETLDFANSHLPAAGNRAGTIDWENQNQQSFELRAGGSNIVPGTWFVLDYNATSIGDCIIKLVEYRNASVAVLTSQTIHQVASRDFNNDGRVDFRDFAILASYWMRTDCIGSNNCGGTDINPVPDGTVNLLDLMYFAEFWLGQFRQNDPIIVMNAHNMNTNSSVSRASSLTSNEMAVNVAIPEIYLMCDNNNPDPNQEVTVYVHSDAPLFAVGTAITITGNASITTAMCEADCINYGWDPGWNSDPYIDDANGVAYISGVRWVSDANGTVGYFKMRYRSGQVSVSINDEWSEAFSFDWQTQTSSDVPFSADTLVFGRDPNQQ